MGGCSSEIGCESATRLSEKVRNEKSVIYFEENAPADAHTNQNFIEIEWLLFSATIGSKNRAKDQELFD